MTIRHAPSCCVTIARRISLARLPCLFLVASHALDCRLVCRLWREYRQRAPCSASRTSSSGLVLKLAGRPCSAGHLAGGFLCEYLPRDSGPTPAREPLLASPAPTRR